MKQGFSTTSSTSSLLNLPPFKRVVSSDQNFINPRGRPNFFEKLSTETKEVLSIPHSRMYLPLRRTTSVSGHIHHKCRRVPRLHENRTRAGKLAHQAFARSFAGYDASACRPFKYILAVPSHKMAVVNDILFVGLQLNSR